MYILQDSTGYWGPTIFFHLVVVFGSLFALNLALAVVADSFDNDEEEDREQEEEGAEKYAATTGEELEDAAEAEELVEAPTCWLSQVCFDMCNANWFAQTVIAMILLNTFSLCLNHKKTVNINGVNQAAEMDQSLIDVLEISNYVFIAIFSIEAAIKLIGLGIKPYFSDSYNTFDFVIVVLSFAEIAMSGGGPLSVLRTFRLLRVLKLTQKFQSMKVILETVASALPSMAYLSLLMGLFMFIAAVAGMQLFAGKMIAPALEEKPRSNFDNFGVAALTVFQIITGENWNEVMFNAMEVTSTASFLYFLIVVCIGTFIILNLTIAIITSNFGEGCAQTIDLTDEAPPKADDDVVNSKMGTGGWFSAPLSTAESAVAGGLTHSLESKQEAATQVATDSSSSSRFASRDSSGTPQRHGDEDLKSKRADWNSTGGEVLISAHDSAANCASSAEMKVDEQALHKKSIQRRLLTPLPAAGTIGTASSISSAVLTSSAKSTAEDETAAASTAKSTAEDETATTVQGEAEFIANMPDSGCQSKPHVELDPELELDYVVQNPLVIEEPDIITELANQVQMLEDPLSADCDTSTSHVADMVDSELDTAYELELKEMLSEQEEVGLSSEASPAGAGSGTGSEGTLVEDFAGDLVTGFYEPPPAAIAVAVDGTEEEVGQAVQSEAWASVFGDTDAAEGTETALAKKVHSIQHKLLCSQYFTLFKANFYISQNQNECLIAVSVTEGVRAQIEKEREEDALEDAKRDWTGCIVPEPPKLTGVSLWVLQPDSFVRESLSKVQPYCAECCRVLIVWQQIVVHPIFDNVVLVLIGLSSLTLAMDGPTLDEDSTLAAVLVNMDIIFTSAICQ